LKEESFEIVIVGASLGGVAAALGAASLGASVCLLEASSWVGGQYSSQGLTRGDEIEGIHEGIGCTASYTRFRQRSSAFYIDNFAISDVGKTMGAAFDPGAPGETFQTTLRIAPRAAHEVLLAMLAETKPQVVVVRNAPVISVDLGNAASLAVIVRSFLGPERRYRGSYLLDATDLGDLLPLANVPFAVGAEGRSEFDEPDAPMLPNPRWIQPITVPIALELRPANENHTIPRPDGYSEIMHGKPFAFSFESVLRNDPYTDSLFNYRQFIAARNFSDSAFPHDVTTINDDNNDYPYRSLPTEDGDADAAVINAARSRSVAYAYWLQTACPRDDGGYGYPNFRVATEVFGTADGTAPCPYIRESRRIKAVTTVRQQDIVSGAPRATLFPDSCGIGYYNLDMHTLIGMPGYDNDKNPPARFQIPLGALIPKATTVERILPACKNLGVTHITNSAYRVHPIEWNVGEAAGMLAAYCASRGVLPRTVVADAARLRELQHLFLQAGMPLFWWTDVPYASASPPVFIATQLVGISGVMSDSNSLEFSADKDLSQEDRTAIEKAIKKTLPWPTTTMSRGQAAQWLVHQLDL
jgi:hypothetical protein